MPGYDDLFDKATQRLDSVANAQDQPIEKEKPSSPYDDLLPEEVKEMSKEEIEKVEQIEAQNEQERSDWQEYEDLSVPEKFGRSFKGAIEGSKGRAKYSAAEAFRDGNYIEATGKALGYVAGGGLKSDINRAVGSIFDIDEKVIETINRASNPVSSLIGDATEEVKKQAADFNDEQYKKLIESSRENIANSEEALKGAHGFVHDVATVTPQVAELAGVITISTVAPPVGGLASTAYLGKMGIETYGGGLMEYDKYELSKGRDPHDNELARQAVGLGNAASEVLAERLLGGISRYMPKKVKSGLGQYFVNKLMKSPAGRESLENAARKFASEQPKMWEQVAKAGIMQSERALGEGLEESVTGAAQFFISNGYMDDIDDQGAGEFWSEIWESAKGGLLMSFMLGPVSGGASKYTRNKIRNNEGIAIAMDKDGQAFEVLGEKDGMIIGQTRKGAKVEVSPENIVDQAYMTNQELKDYVAGQKQGLDQAVFEAASSIRNKQTGNIDLVWTMTMDEDAMPYSLIEVNESDAVVVDNETGERKIIPKEQIAKNVSVPFNDYLQARQEEVAGATEEAESETIETPEVDLSPGNTIELNGQIGNISEVTTDGTILLETEQGTMEIPANAAQNARPATIIELDAETHVPAIETENGLEIFEEFIDQEKAQAVTQRLNELFQGKRVFEMVPFDNENPNQPNKIKVIGRQYEAEPAPGIDDAGNNNQGPEAIQPEQPAPQTPLEPEGSGGAVQPITNEVEAQEQEQQKRTITDGENDFEVTDLGENTFQIGGVINNRKEAEDLMNRLESLYGRKLDFGVDVEESDDPFALDNYRVVAEPTKQVENEAETGQEINPQVDLPDYSLNGQEVSRGMAKLAIKKAKSPEDIAGLQIKEDEELKNMIADKFPPPEYSFEGEPLTREEVAVVVENAQTIEDLEGIEVKNDPELEQLIQDKFAPQQEEVAEAEQEQAPADAKENFTTEDQNQQAGEYIENVSQNKELDRAGQDVEQNPTEAQKEAGNYKKGHIKIHGLDITIENPKGSNRAGVDEDGNAWSQTMNHHYGYFKRSEGKDGDQVDVFIGDNPTSTKVFAIDQINPKTGEFDEHKILLGFNSAEEAREAYLSNYEDGWQGIGDMAETTIDEFKNWLKNDDTTQPIAYGKESDQPGVEAEAKPSPEGEAVSEPITPEVLEQRIIDYLTKNMGEQASFAPETVIPSFFNTTQIQSFLKEQAEFANRRNDPESAKAFKEALDGVNQDNIINHFKAQKKQQEADRVSAHNKIVDMLKAYNAMPQNHTNKRAALLNDISNAANKLGYRVGSEGQNAIVTNEQNKPIKKIPVRQSKEEIEAHKALSDYSQEFQDFVNDRFENDPDQLNVYYPLSKKQVQSGIKAIKEGRKTVAANTLLDEMEGFYNAGSIPLVVPTTKEVVNIPIEEIIESEKDAQLQEFSYLQYEEAFQNGLINAEERQLIENYAQYEQEREQEARDEARREYERRNAETGKRSGETKTNPETRQQEKPDLTEGQRAEINKRLGEIDGQIEAQQKEISNARKAHDKKWSELNNRSGLFGDTKADPNELFAGQFLANRETMKKAIRPYEERVDKAEKELARLQKLRQGIIDNAGKQGDLYGNNQTNKKPAKKNKPQPKNKTYGTNNKVVSKDRYEELKRKIRQKGNNLNSGVDPEMVAMGAEMAAYHIEAGARKFKDFAQNMINDLGEWVKPYLKSFYSSARYYPGMEEYSPEMDADSEVQNFDVETIKPQDDAELSTGDTESDSPSGTNENSGNGADVSGTSEQGGQTGRDSDTVNSESNRETPEYNDESAEDGINDLGRTAPVDRKRSNNKFRRQESGRKPESDTTGNSDTSRSGSIDTKGQTQPDRGTDGRTGTRNRKSGESPSPVRRGDLTSIQETLPQLFPEQQTDVLRAEERFFTGENTGKGKLFTNGTGTGKTYTGLGIAKRFMLEGKTNILFVVPTDAKAKDWIEEGTNLDVSVTQLKDTKDNGGDGPIVTTYANFYQNEALNNREFDLVIYDEAHYLGQNEGGDATNAFKKHRLVANLPSAARTKAELIAGERPSQPEESRLYATPEVEKQWEQYDNNLKAWNDRYEKAYRELVDKTKVVFLSATPFAYHKSLAWGDGTLFDITETVEKGEDQYLGYNEAGGFAKFLTENLGYRMRYNKATIPESGVDVSLLERQLFEKFVKEGVFTGRQLKVDKDYSREFVDVGTDLGERINEGMKEFSPLNKEFAEKYPILANRAHKKWNYLYMNQLMEGIKAHNSVERIQKHLDMGRKVVVFHGYNNALPTHPFRFTVEELFSRGEMADPKNVHAMAQAETEIAEFESEYPQYASMDLSELSNPRKELAEAFGERMREFNGTIPKKKRFGYIAEFNDENSGVDLLVVQRKAGKEGISLHDKNGTKQRVLVDLGLPTAPTDAIQSEGRIYRLGVQSNAIFEYPIINTDFERMAFAMKVAERSKTAENFAMGNRARNLQNAFIEGYSNPINESPNENQGEGGKEFDEQVLDVSEFDQAKTFYFARGKKSSSNKSQEGTDYFATPEPIGYKMAEWLGLQPNEKGMEPSAGHGAIARFFPGHANNTFIEPSFKLSSQLAMVADGSIKQSAFEDLNKINKFHGIAMNPPFGKSGKTAMEHVEKAFGHLYDGGRIVAIVPNGPAMQKRLDEFLYGENDKGKQNNPSAVVRAEITLPNVTFERAATNVGTKIVVIDKVEDEGTRQTIDPERRIDMSNITEIGELFDNMEDLGIPPRVDTGNNVAEEQENQQDPVETSSETSEIFGEVTEYEHTKTGQILYNVPLNNRIENFSDIAAIARNNNPYNKRKAYSRYSKGFLFESEADANNFRKEAIEASNDGVKFKRKKNFYSPTERALSKIGQEKGTAGQFRSMLLRKGAKEAELNWMGFDEQFSSDQKVTRTELQEWIDENKVELEEVTKEKPSPEEAIKKFWIYEGMPDELYTTESDALDAAREDAINDYSDSDLYDENGDVDYAKFEEIEGAYDHKVRQADESDLTDEIEERALSGGVKYLDYTTPGGTNYREVLLTMPKKKDGEFKSSHFDEPNIVVHTRTKEFTDKEGNRVLLIEEVQSDWAQEGRKKGFSDKSKTYTTENTKIEETDYGYKLVNSDGLIISDISNEGLGSITNPEEIHSELLVLANEYSRKDEERKAPNMPFKNTPQWSGLALKRMMQYASENGFDKLAWVTGEQSAERYDLSKQVDKIDVMPFSSYRDVTIDHKTGSIPLTVNNDGVVIDGNAESIGKPLDEVIGKEMADKILNTDANKTYKGLDLKVGGEGMKSFYDKILPNTARKIFGKKTEIGTTDIVISQENQYRELGDGQLLENETGDVVTEPETRQVHSIEITSELRDRQMQVQSLFKRMKGDALTAYQTARERYENKTKVIETAKESAKEFGVPIHVVDNVEDLPNQKRFDEKDKDQVQAIYDETSGVVFIVANNLPAEETRRVIIHEVIGHKGVKQVLGDKMESVLQKVYESIPKVDRENLQAIYGDNQLTIAEEYIADLAENYKRPNFLRRIVAQVRNMIRKAFGISYSTNDIMYLLSRSESKIKRNPQEGYVSVKGMEDGNPLQFGENPLEGKMMFKRKKPKQESTADLRKTGDRVREKAQDRMITLKRLQQEVVNRGGKVEWFHDAYEQENRSHGRILYETERVGKQLVDPLIKAVYDVTGSNKAEDLAELQRYMKAKHAPERNRVISKKKELDEIENQSGFTDEEAAEIVEAYEADKDPEAIKALWDNVRNLTGYTLNRWLTDGFISKETFESMTKGEDAYKYYVPLRGFADVGESVFQYQNKDASKVVSPLREAKGRESESDDPIEYIVNMAQTAIVMGENNRIKQYAYRMIKANSPTNPEEENNFKDLFHLKKAYYVSTGVTDAQGNEIVNVQYERPGQELFDRGLVQTRFNNKRMALNNPQNKEHEVTVMVNGERLTMSFANPEVANAINKDNIRRLPQGIFGDVLRGTGVFTRWLTANFTAKNPAFIAPNTVRDVAYAMLSHAIKGSGKDAARFTKHIAKIGFSNIGTSGIERDTKYGKYYREFMANGAATGYVHLKDVDQIARDVDKALTRAKRGKDGSFIFNNEGYLRIWKKAGEIMDIYAQKSENMSRLATYIMAREDGKSEAEAATAAKNITVNFNRKGTESTLFGSLYAFMNAAIQGGENLARIAKEHKGKFVGAAASMYAWGFITALISHINDDDEDDPNNYSNINDYMKQKNFTFRYGKDRYISIPLPHGWRVFYGMGVSTMENLFLDEEKKSKFNWAREDRAWDKMIFDFIDSSIDATSSVNPMDAFAEGELTLSGAIKVITPTAAMPIADIATNRDFAGRTIRREPFTNQLEELEANAGLYKRNVNFVLKGLTDKLYQAGGGDVDIYAKQVLKDGELEKVGWMYDWNPSNIEHFVTYLTGGRGRFYNQVIKTTSSVVAGASDWATGNVEGIQEVDMNDVPIVNRFNRQAYDYGMYSQYYKLKDDIAAYKYAFNQYGIEKKVQNINPKMEMLDDKVKDIDKQLTELRDMRSMVASDPDKYKELKEQEKQIIENFLNAINYDNGNQ